jgi:hypothetical protein
LIGLKVEYVVTLHGETDVVTAYPSEQQANAIALWQRIGAATLACAATDLMARRYEARQSAKA